MKICLRLAPFRPATTWQSHSPELASSTDAPTLTLPQSRTDKRYLKSNVLVLCIARMASDRASQSKQQKGTVMGRPTNMRATGAAPADKAEGPQPAIALASVRPSPLPENPNCATGTEPNSNANNTASLDRLDIAGRMTALREAFERHTRSDKSKVSGEDWRDHLSGLRSKLRPIAAVF